MELLSLEMERFGCVARASIAFKSGLNVLHGSNEIGKSSIARAIRFALLLPSASSASQGWVPWTGGGDPSVTLVFRKGPTDYYRVRKVFGTTTAVLERSPNGRPNSWTSLARAREVDARLRALLEWGVPEPGGAKAPKGLPESFLAGALLADQDAVTKIFDCNLEKDGSDSGRSRIRAALQAIAQDPLFKSVLDAAQARVDEAFLASGQRKRGTNDLFPRIAKEVAARREEHENALRDAERGRALARQVRDLQKSAAQAEAELQEAKTKHRRLEKLRGALVALSVASDARNRGQMLVDAVSEAKEKVATAESVLHAIEPRLPALLKIEEDARKTFEAATAKASAGREKRHGELAQEETAILREREALRVRQAAVDAALDLRNASALEDQAKVLASDIEALDVSIAILDAVEPWMELREARSTLEAAEHRTKDAAGLLAKAKELREHASKEWPSADTEVLPDTKRLDELRRLRGKLDIANAKLGVGLAVDVRGTTSAAVTIDDAGRETKSSPFSIEANASVRLQLAGGVEIEVRGGRTADRALAEQTRKQWADATESLFAAARVKDFDGLVEACTADAENKARADALEREAATADAKRIGIGNPVADKQVLDARIGGLEGRIADLDKAAVEAAATAHGKTARSVHTSKLRERESKRNALAKLLAQAASHRERAAGSNNVTPIDDPVSEGSAIASKKVELGTREGAIAEERKALDAPRGKRDALEESAMNAKRALDDALVQVATAKTDREVWDARLQERVAAAASVQLDTLKKTEDEARAAAGNHPQVDDAILASSRAAEEKGEERLETVVGNLRKAEGALLGSGGAVADERARDLDVALRRAHEKQGALEDEYEAWRLLCDTLKEAERTQATHLGSALAPDLAARFQALAGTRYGGVALGPHLSLEGVHAVGDRRDLDRLSIGTREQLSTLFRLCLAERLRSALLLDDQLVQSDPDRLRWFRQALRDTARTGVQVIVLTCRPDDYLEPAETPPPHVIDLGGVVLSDGSA